MANTASPIATRTRRSSRSIRDEVTHPIVDIDGHVIEHVPSLLPHLRESLGADLFTLSLPDEIDSMPEGMPICSPATAPASSKACSFRRVVAPTTVARRGRRTTVGGVCPRRTPSIAPRP